MSDCSECVLSLPFVTTLTHSGANYDSSPWPLREVGQHTGDAWVIICVCLC